MKISTMISAAAISAASFLSTPVIAAEDKAVNGVTGSELVLEMTQSENPKVKSAGVFYMLAVFEIGVVADIVCPRPDTTYSMVGSVGAFSLRQAVLTGKKPAAQILMEGYVMAFPCKSGASRKSDHNPSPEFPS